MRATDMTQGCPGRLIVAFALPMMLGNVCQQLYTIVDGAFVGRFAGITALAAVGAADWLCWLFMGIVQGYTIGFSVLISQRFGARDVEGLKKVVGMSVSLTAALALLLTAVSQAALGLALSLLGTPEDIFPQAVLYLRILFIGLPIFAAYNVMAAMLRAVGDAKSPLIAMLIASFANIALDGLFVVSLHWGVAGAAAATLIAQGASAVYCFLVIRRLPMIRFGREDLRWEGRTVRRLISLGTPMAAQNLIIGLGGMAVQRVINGFGRVFIAGFTATNKIYGLMEMAATSYGAALASYTGQNFGAKRFGRIRQGVNTGIVLGVVTALLIAAVLFITGRGVLSLFVDPAEELLDQVLDVAQLYLNYMLAALAALYLLYVYRSALQGMGDTLTPMISGIVELLMRVGTAMVLPRFLGQRGVYYAEPAAWLGAEILLMIMYYVRIGKYKEET